MDPPSDVRERLDRWIADRLAGATDVRISGLRRPAAGESSDTQLFECHWTEAGSPRSLAGVLRCAPGAGGPFPEYDMGMQFRLMRALRSHTDVPVPEVLWLEESPDVLGVPFLVMRAVDGDAPLDRPSYQAEGFYHEASPETRAHMWDATVAAVARLHGADWRKLAGGCVPGSRAGEDPVRHALVYWRRYLDEWLKDEPSERVPVFDEALVWLEEHRPPPERLALCWGDAKLGNVLYERGTRGIAAILDWELASVGDPEQDLASLHLSDLRAQDGAGGTGLPGTPSADELVRCYEAHSGRPFRNFRYQLVFATFWRGAVQLRVMRQLRAQGVPIEDALFVNNFPVRQLCQLLDLSPPA